ncbi:hypothetical protein [Fluviicola taffensis]|uniref:Lipoprotein n=1 Tax=Fluviicola taffensis (strain DSM 16823 / NCIMB 13979 / RW262) TaxID=755732 RepID=F2IJ35_FLUTR|nr:hypothetical protein [Fluviicola taffensis]AEA43893.1 hypothetical protein Fluta_1906 [Fluviicola taffensis DSM 16823]
MRNLLFILFGTLFLVSCGKKRSIHITATNAATGERYAGLQYYIVSSTTSGNGEKYKTEKSGFLNENGEATEIIREKQYRTYAVRVVEPENSCYNKEITQYFDSPYDVDGTFTFEFAGCANLKLNINNINCQGASDYFKLYYMGRQVGGQGSNIVGALSLQGGGCYSYTGNDFSSVPMGNMYWKWEVTRNNVTTTYYDTINFSAGEYKIYDINY